MSESASATRADADAAWTVRRVLEWSIGFLKQHSSPSPRLDAEILLAHARGCRRIELYTQYDAELSESERERMRHLIKRRAAAEPVAYLVGFREFYGYRFDVRPGVLIPRPETELLVLETLARLSTVAAPRILDLCTGSGCVAISLALQHSSAQVTAVEIDDDACEIARANIDRHKVGERVRLLQGDLFTPLGDERFDAIVGNPPYVREDELEGLPDDVRLHEPQRALLAGVDGLDVIRPLIEAAPRYLASGGCLLIEMDPAQVEPVSDLLAQDSRWGESGVVADLSGAQRVVWARAN